MPSISTIGSIAALSGGAVAGGLGGYRYSQRRDDFDTEDKLGFAASSAIAGAAGGLALKAVGIRRMGSATGKAIKSTYITGKTLMANPARRVMRAMGRKKFGLRSIPGPLRTAGAIGLTAVAGIAAIAYSSRSNPQTTAYASPDGTGGTDYNTQTVRERMGLLGATGDLVFGLNNARHG